MKLALSTLMLGTLALSGCANQALDTADPVAAAEMPSLSSVETAWNETVQPDAAKADLAALYSGLRAAHYDLFANRTEAEYDALYELIEAELSQPVTRFELFLALQRFTEYGNVAHARIDFPSELYAAYRDRGGRALPVYPRIDEGLVFIGEDFSGNPNIVVGDRLIAVDGRPIDELLAEMMLTISGDTPAIEHSLLEFVFPARLWAITGERESHTLTVGSDQGETRTVEVRTLTSEEQREKSEAETSGEVAPLREARMIEDGIAYMKPGPFYNADDGDPLWEPNQVWNNERFVQFIDASFEDFLESGAETLILDLRNNPGGDNSFSDPMLAWIADAPFSFASSFKVRSSAQSRASNAARLEASGATEGPSQDFADLYAVTPFGEDFDYPIALSMPRDGARFEGEVYALIDRNSYSNAVNVASILKDYGWATLVGEPTTDFATTLGAMESFTLPESGLTVGYPKAHIIRPNGDPTPGPVTPDIPIEISFSDGAFDPVLDELVRRVTE